MSTTRKGLADVTDGEKWEWYGSGKTSFSGGRSLSMSYGVSSSIEASIASKVSLGISTSVSAQASVQSSLGAGMSYSKDYTLSTSRAGSSSYQNSYASTVGADTASKTRLTALTTALHILLGAQTATLIGLMAHVAVVQATAEGPVEEVYSHPGFPMSSAASIMTAIAAVAAAIMAFMAKIQTFTETNNPAAALTMDADQGAFLGINRQQKIAGITLSETAIDLGIANGKIPGAPGPGVSYKKAGDSTTIVGLDGNPGEKTNGGARMQLTATGDVMVTGQGLLNMSTENGAHIQSSLIDIKAMDGTSGMVGGLIDLRLNSASMAIETTNTLTLKPDDVTLMGGSQAKQSLVKLSSSSGSLATGGNSVNTSTSAVTLQFGQTKVKLDATGFAVGSDLTVLAPGAPGLTSATLQRALADVNTLKAQQTKDNAQLKASMKLSAVNLLSSAALHSKMIQLRQRVEKLTQDLGSQ